jgi:hypothetical protein
VCLLELPAGQAKFPLLKAAKLVRDNKPVLILAVTEGTGRNTDSLVSIFFCETSGKFIKMYTENFISF